MSVSVSIADLENMTLKELYSQAKTFKVSYYSKLTKRELIFAILKAQAEQDGLLFMEGVLDIIQTEGLVFYDQLIICRAQKTFISLPHKYADSIYVTAISLW